MNENETIVAILKAEVIKLKVEKSIYGSRDKYQPVLDEKIIGLEKEIKKFTKYKTKRTIFPKPL